MMGRMRRGKKPKPIRLDHWPPREEEVTGICRWCGRVTHSPIGPSETFDEAHQAYITEQTGKPLQGTWEPSLTDPATQKYMEDASVEPISGSICDECNAQFILPQLERLRARRAARQQEPPGGEGGEHGE